MSVGKIYFNDSAIQDIIPYRTKLYSLSDVRDELECSVDPDNGDTDFDRAVGDCVKMFERRYGLKSWGFIPVGFLFDSFIPSRGVFGYGGNIRFDPEFIDPNWDEKEWKDEIQPLLEKAQTRYGGCLEDILWWDVTQI